MFNFTPWDYAEDMECGPRAPLSAVARAARRRRCGTRYPNPPLKRRQARQQPCARARRGVRLRTRSLHLAGVS
jgi:hypothetical protein